MARLDLNHYARRGAEARAEELRAELEAIYGAFPDLRPTTGGGGGRRRGSAEAPASGTPRRRRRRMSPAQRKAVSARMKKYWAARRNAKTPKK